jgi:hypothetical protein
MLAYLEELCSALLAHDAAAVHRLLGHPLARSLPRQVREEALAISRAHPSSLRAPIQVLRFYHQTLQLGEPGETADAETIEDGDSDDHMDRELSDRQDRAPLVGGNACGPACDCVDQIELPLEVMSNTQAVAA